MRVHIVGLSVPKEAVVTFTGVVEDMGADRGLMFSEKGCEAGAIHQANHTDVLLTGVADFADSGLTGSSNRPAGQRSVHTGDQICIQNGALLAYTLSTPTRRALSVPLHAGGLA